MTVNYAELTACAGRTLIMGVLNVTPDSFSDGGLYLDPEAAVKRAREMVEQGADIIDIGGESSRPGSMGVTADEELRRIVPVLDALKGSVGVPVSVDTAKSSVALEAIKRGASIINDITALRGDKDMAGVISDNGAGVVLMHMKGTPRSMQDKPRYDDVVGEITSFLLEAVRDAEEAGIDPGKIIVDPGIGFGKTFEDNLEILRNLAEFKVTGKPVLVGTSNKSFIGGITGRPVGERSYGTAASVTAAVLYGADIVRVHDVSAMKDVVGMAQALMAGETS